MLKGLNHVAIAVPDLLQAANLYRALGASVSEPIELPAHGVIVVFIELSNTKIELLHPLGEASPIAAFLEKNPSGGLHHLCFEVDNIHAASAAIIDVGARILGDGKPKLGAHDNPVVFAHPKDFQGTLVEFEQT